MSTEEHWHYVPRTHTQEVSLFAGVVRARATLCGKAIRATRRIGPFQLAPSFAQENILNDVSLAAGFAAPPLALVGIANPSDPGVRGPSRPNQTGETSAEPSRPIYNSASHCDERRHRTITGSQSVAVVAAPSPNGRFLQAAEELFSHHCR